MAETTFYKGRVTLPFLLVEIVCKTNQGTQSTIWNHPTTSREVVSHALKVGWTNTARHCKSARGWTIYHPFVANGCTCLTAAFQDKPPRIPRAPNSRRAARSSNAATWPSLAGLRLSYPKEDAIPAGKAQHVWGASGTQYSPTVKRGVGCPEASRGPRPRTACAAQVIAGSLDRGHRRDDMLGLRYLQDWYMH